jgi:hypothetical protein
VVARRAAHRDRLPADEGGHLVRRPVPELLEPEVLSAFRVRVLERIDDIRQRVATIEEVQTNVVFGTPERAREHAAELFEHPQLRDAPVEDNLPEQLAGWGTGHANLLIRSRMHSHASAICVATL